MSVDPSILVWMILNFLLLMFLLNRFLFQPVLAFMKQREEKLEAGRQAREEARSLINESRDHINRDMARTRADILSQTEKKQAQLAEETAAYAGESEKALAQHHQQTATDLYEREERLARSAETHMEEYIAILQQKLSATGETAPLPAADGDFRALVRAGAAKGALKEGAAE